MGRLIPHRHYAYPSHAVQTFCGSPGLVFCSVVSSVVSSSWVIGSSFIATYDYYKSFYCSKKSAPRKRHRWARCPLGEGQRSTPSQTQYRIPNQTGSIRSHRPRGHCLSRRTTRRYEAEPPSVRCSGEIRQGDSGFRRNSELRGGCTSVGSTRDTGRGHFQRSRLRERGWTVSEAQSISRGFSL